jgi:hypothetical protein
MSGRLRYVSSSMHIQREAGIHAPIRRDKPTHTASHLILPPTWCLLRLP